MSVKYKFNIKKYIYDILLTMVDFCENFRDFGCFFCYPDPFPDPADQIETDQKQIRIRIRNTARRNWTKNLICASVADPDTGEGKA